MYGQRYVLKVVLKQMGSLNMERTELVYFKNLLTAWLEELQNSAYTTVEGLLNVDSFSADYLDRASFESDTSTALRIRDRESMLINKIRKSLEDIDNGEYGICEDCGREIAIARLRARPIARRCIECKTKQEALEKIMGI
jgi:DnaK suppressor protein